MFSGGKGTEEKPYLISSINDLIEIKNYPESHFRQTQNIDLDGINWEPIPFFHGTYDGQNFKIKNLNVNSNQSYLGLFGICSNATVKNIEIINAKVQGNGDGAGILSGIIYSSEVTDCHIIKGTAQGTNVGALASTIENSMVSRCGIEQIEVQGYRGGGFATFVTDSDIDNCCVSGTVSGNYLGTFVYHFYSGTIKNCYTVVNMMGYDNTNSNIYAFAHNFDGVILSCYTDITAGVTQLNWDPNVNYYSIGTMIRGTDMRLYQLINGQPNLDWEYWEPEWNQTGPPSWWPPPNYAAQPVAGSNWQKYWAPADIPEGRTTSQMRSKSNFVGWDFENVWKIKEGRDYPRLIKKSQIHCTAFTRQAGLTLTPIGD